ncbi:hypothetical protein F5H01DRAFT_339101 [Linnemannia elongata]|nr:hypothetical protein F5H01DRAFT_339101 [Linnemannia elongata]
MSEQREPQDVPTPAIGPAASGGWTSEQHTSFDIGVNTLKSKLDEAVKALKEHPDDPALLADYQSALAEYHMYRTSQADSIKSFTDLSKDIIKNLG